MAKCAKVDGSGSQYCVSDLTETSYNVEVHGAVTSLSPMKCNRVASGECGMRYPCHATANVAHVHNTVVRVDCIPKA